MTQNVEKTVADKNLTRKNIPGTDVPMFDWVAERSSCTLPKVFQTLRTQVEEDVRTRNAQRLAGSRYEFLLKEDIDKFTVLLESEVVSQAVVFKLAEHAILVLSAEGASVFEVKLVFDDQGKCRLTVDGELRDFWQVRRMALEDLLFRHY